MMQPTLSDIFEIQDEHVQANRDAMSEEVLFLEKAVPLLKESLEVLKSDPIHLWRREVSDQVLQTEGIRLNLAQAMWCTVINMCRLLEFGSFVNFLSLYRDALEMYAYFWYLGENPSEVSKWDDLVGTPKSLIDLGKEDYPRFLKKVVKKFQRWAAADRYLEEAYTLFSTLGTHTNPHSISMFLATENHKNNLGFCSSGEGENLRCSAHSVLHLIMSLLNDLYTDFEEHLPDSSSRLRKVALMPSGGRRVFIYVPTSLLLHKHSLRLPTRHASLQSRFGAYDCNFDGEWDFW